MRLDSGTPTTFRCGGFTLYGTLHRVPDGVRSREIGIVLINAGPTDRAGPHRLYIKLARRLSAMGYPVLRFDPRGTGESQGYCSAVVETKPMIEFFSIITQGLWVPDTRMAIDHMISQTGCRSVILAGHCGGALTALAAGHDHAAVSALILSGTPVTASAMTGDVADLPEEILKRDSILYVRKLLRPSAWLRFLSFRTDYRVLGAVLWARIRDRLGTPRKDASRDRGRKLSPWFLRPFEAARRNNKPMLFVYGDSDYLWREFESNFLASVEGAARSGFQLVVIENSNHNMTERVWQETAFGAITAWLNGHPVEGDQVVRPWQAWSGSAVKQSLTGRE